MSTLKGISKLGQRAHRAVSLNNENGRSRSGRRYAKEIFLRSPSINIKEAAYQRAASVVLLYVELETRTHVSDRHFAFADFMKFPKLKASNTNFQKLDLISQAQICHQYRVPSAPSPLLSP